MAVDDCMALLARHDLALVGKWMSRGRPALLNQPLEPIVPLVHHSLHRFGRKPVMPTRAAKQQHVFRFRLRNISETKGIRNLTVETMLQLAG